MNPRYEWKDDQLWDNERGCWVIWRTISGQIGATDDIRDKISKTLNRSELFLSISKLDEIKYKGDARINYKYRIGDFVEVKATISFGYDEENNVIYEREEKLAQAQIIGFKHRPIGKYIRTIEDGYNVSYLKQKGTIKVWLVKFGLLNKEQMVLEEDITIMDNEYDYELPIKYTGKISAYKRSQMPSELLHEIDEVLMNEGVFIGGRLDSIKRLIKDYYENQSK